MTSALERLEEAIRNQLGNEVVIHYSQVAAAFPSSAPHPYSFEKKLIDEPRLFQWAEKSGWEVEVDRDPQADKEPFDFHIRFTRKVRSE